MSTAGVWVERRESIAARQRHLPGCSKKGNAVVLHHLEEVRSGTAEDERGVQAPLGSGWVPLLIIIFIRGGWVCRQTWYYRLLRVIIH